MIICGKVYIKNPIIIIYNITKNTIMEPFSITNIQQDEYRELQSAYHTMINALRKWETTGITYPTKVLKMIMTMR